MTKELMDAYLAGGLLIMMIALLASVITYAIMEVKFERLKKEAVKKGYGEWVVDDEGYTKFHWKDGEVLSS
jgi:hypothetical protein